MRAEDHKPVDEFVGEHVDESVDEFGDEHAEEPVELQEDEQPEQDLYTAQIMLRRVGTSE